MICGMPSRESLVHQGRRRGERLTRELAEEFREARLRAGLSLRSVGDAVRLSAATIHRIENARQAVPDLVTAATIARVLGLDLAVRCYPIGGLLRDAAHVALIIRFLAQLPASVIRRLEAPIRIDRDLRAWDVLLTLGRVTIGVAAETRLRDVQALLRREQAKQRDSGVTRLLLVAADTRGNRAAISEARDLLASAGFLGPRKVMHSLRRGEDPGGDGWVLI